MKAAVCDVFGKPLAVREVPTPSAGPGQLLIRVHGCGVCHSDLHLIDGDWAAWGTPLPIIPGHEVTGIVETIGAGVTEFAADHGIRSMVERHPLSAVNDVLGKLRDGKVRLRAVLTPE